MQAKKQKLEQQDLSTVNDSNIFKGISVFVNGYTGEYVCYLGEVAANSFFYYL
jgi:hypothetical protein